jgi:radical SAM superfamily enzyme YgiQ (UPF0313 family)
MGLPEEDEEDVKQTIQLIKEVDNRFAFYFPIFFVPIGTTQLKDYRRFIRKYASPYHWRLILQCWKHNVKYMCRAFDFVAQEEYPILRLGLRIGIKVLYDVIQMQCIWMIDSTKNSKKENERKT